ncbi:MAG TPA: hypothetical protein VKQ31_04920, partial [Steroidobacteraceae bacterium]|nr:hypothetical protein [Steroidobacteraceae bacterium]
MRVGAPVLLLFVCCAFALPLCGQVRHTSTHEPAAETFKLTTFKLNGSSEYTGTEVLAASGLHLGESVTQDTLQQAT